jgi:hypothetical protein
MNDPIISKGKPESEEFLAKLNEQEKVKFETLFDWSLSDKSLIPRK